MYLQKSFLLSTREFSEYQERTYSDLMSKIGSPSDDEVVGVHAVAGCKLPSHSESHVSVFSEQLIQVAGCHLIVTR